MAKTLSFICNHNMQFTDTATLAKELSLRLNATVKYGYEFSIVWNHDEKRIDSEFKPTIIGACELASATKTYFINDQKIAIAAVQSILASSPQISEYKIDDYLLSFAKEQIDELDNEFEVAILNDENKIDDFLGYVRPNTIDFLEEEYIELRTFDELFLTDSTPDEYMEYTHAWRKKAMEFVRQMGGSFMIGLCYENSSVHIPDILASKDIVDGMKEIEQRFKYQIVNIPRSFLEKDKYEKRKDLVYGNYKMFSRIETYKELTGQKIEIPELTYPIVFYDDFEDLDPTFRGENLYFQYAYDPSLFYKQMDARREILNNFKIQRVALPYFKDPAWERFRLNYSVKLKSFLSQCSTQDELQLKINQEVFLVREPANFISKNAVAVHIQKEGVEGFDRMNRIGYLGKDVIDQLAPILDSGKKIRAFIDFIREEDIDGYNNNNAVFLTLFQLKEDS